MRGETRVHVRKLHKPLRSQSILSRALALDDDPTKCESGKVKNGKEVLAFKSAVDRLEMKARNLRLRFIAL